MPPLWPWGVHLLYAFALLVVAVGASVRFLAARVAPGDEPRQGPLALRCVAAWVVSSGLVSALGYVALYVVLCLWVKLSVSIEHMPWLEIATMTVGEPFASVLLAALLGGLLTVLWELRARSPRA